MAAASNTTYPMVGEAEDIEDAIFNISPTETPFMSMAKRKTASAVFHQWQTDSLASVATNQAVEGDDATFGTAAPTSLLGNYCQISTKTLFVSRTADKVRKYGRAKELAYLTVKKGRELKRDMEYALVGAQISTAGAVGASARSSAGLEAMIAGNRILCGAGTTGTTPGYAGGVWGAVTDGTASATLTEANLVSGISAAWTDGGDPKVIMLGMYQKQKIAAFTGATKYAGTYINGGKAQAALVGAVDVYISDVGEHKLVLNRHMKTSIVFGIDPEYVSVAFLDGIKMEDLAKTGDAEKKMLVTEFCLVADNPDAHFKLQQLVAA